MKFKRYTPKGKERDAYKKLVASITKKRTEIKKRQSKYKPRTLRSISINFAPPRPITLKRGFTNRYEYEEYVAGLKKENRKSADLIMRQNIRKYQNSFIAAFDASFSMLTDTELKNMVRDIRAYIKAMTAEEFLKFVEKYDVGKIDYWYDDEDAFSMFEEMVHDLQEYLNKNILIVKRVEHRRELARERSKRYREKYKK